MSKKAVIRGTFRARSLLRELGFPYGDDIELQSSLQEFEGGGQYGIEIPVINSLSVLEKTVKLLDERGITVSRLNETIGAFFLSDSEIKEMLACCSEKNMGMTFSLGPRPEFDRKASFYRSEFGLEQARRLNNNDAIAASVDEALRLTDMGCRGLVVYDPGVLLILSELKIKRIIPKETIFILSSHAMTTNPMIAKMHLAAGADSAVVLHDLDLVVLQEIRRMAPKLVMDIPIDVYPSKGGFMRFHEIPEMIQVAAPIMLKMGTSAQPHPYTPVADVIIEKRVDRVSLALEAIEKFQAPLVPMNAHCPDRCIPVIE